ncbi:MAG: cytidylate kinase [Gammaproteobacteria bacterium]|jgi:cytidylate kinase|tara:strand:- start:2475 stop:3158 length:684 start_codon:yes stop_codon:yes gene_type:complete
MSSIPVIAIDGPGGAGKGTIAKAVARQLGWHLLDSGALYRLVALTAIRRGVAWEDAQGLAALARNLDVRFDFDAAEGGILMSNEDVSQLIRQAECSLGASFVAALPAVRGALIQRQRDFQAAPGLVADGRDMGSVVFPGAALKIFLTATIEERALRRYKQLKDKGMDANLRDLSSELEERDRRDSEREIAPLKPGPDSRLLDTTGLSISDVVQTVLSWVAEAYPANP